VEISSLRCTSRKVGESLRPLDGGWLGGWGKGGGAALLPRIAGGTLCQGGGRQGQQVWLGCVGQPAGEKGKFVNTDPDRGWRHMLHLKSGGKKGGGLGTGRNCARAHPAINEGEWERACRDSTCIAKKNS